MLAYKLAIEFGCPSPMGLLESMSSNDITSWHAYNAMSPIGGERLDYLAAGIMSTIVNTEPAVKKRVTLHEMLIRWRDNPADRKKKIKQAWSNVVKMWRLRNG